MKPDMPLSFSPYFVQSEESAVKALLRQMNISQEQMTNASEYAAKLIHKMREQKQPLGQLESFLQEYSLNTEEGLALMTLAEALLRIPDKKTAHKLIHDKVAAANWLDNVGGSKDWIVKAAGVGLFMTSKTLDSVIARVSEPFMHQAMIKAMGILGKQFVLGEDIESAFQNAQYQYKNGYNISYDILGEGARTAIDAQHYIDSYSAAIDYIGQRADPKATMRPGISVKLSALHPRYEAAQSANCIPEMSLILHDLAKKAAHYNIRLTVDAEETPRLNTSIAIIKDVINAKDLRDWEGFGLAIQAYHKAAPELIDHIADQAKTASKRIHIRLVKGAYWDSEIKNAQIAGLPDFPVYTRKRHTDLSYIVCADKIFEHAEHCTPLIATHNAHSIATIMNIAIQRDVKHYEFQRLFGMGEQLYNLLRAEHDMDVSIYAPVGPHHDLLPYLVRRLLENGANTSFVNRVMNPNASVDDLVVNPVDKIKNRKRFKHPLISLSKDLFKDEKPTGRSNSEGLDLNAPEIMHALEHAASSPVKTKIATSIINGMQIKETVPYSIHNPAQRHVEIGKAYPASRADIENAYTYAKENFESWNTEKADIRAQILNRTAELFEHHREELIALLVQEAGKTIPDAHDEIREAVDFCRYYAAQGQNLFSKHALTLPGPTGESNTLSLTGRGVFICISPWNFPLAIFTGQIVAALMAGNAVIAKPAEQTPLIATRAIQLMHKAGIPTKILNLVIGDGRTGEMLINHHECAGVAFTGSNETARIINMALADKKGAITPLIAETGGQNAMIVDSSALPEQVIDDVILSAFGSSGQRCSALRILCLQSDSADTILRMLKGRIDQMTLGDPSKFLSDIGPVIDEEAHAILTHHHQALEGFGQLIARAPMKTTLIKKGHFFAPCAYEIPSLHNMNKEIFGPILHVIRYERDELNDLLHELRDMGYGLTLGIHSRIKTFQDEIIAKMPVGNIYINRSMTGAIVGSQPFGGMGLSGTGPKAGGPHYLLRFAHEKTVSNNTTAAGGNAYLVSLEE